MDMEQRIRAVWKTVPEAHEPFSEYVATTFGAIVTSSRYMCLSHSSTANMQQSMVDGSLALVHNTNAGNSEIEAFASLVSLEGQQHRKRKRKKQRKKNKLGTNPLSQLQHNGCSIVHGTCWRHYSVTGLAYHVFTQSLHWTHNLGGRIAQRPLRYHVLPRARFVIKNLC